MAFHAGGPRNIGVMSFDENKSVPNLFCAYSKQELVEQLSKAEKPAAAVLLQVGSIRRQGVTLHTFARLLFDYVYNLGQKGGSILRLTEMSPHV